MKQNFSSDKPVENESQDRFQRYNFSKRIAETIQKRESPDGIVIGIYGAWGEGKTSVQNFIEQELKTDDTILIIKLNPWRYNDEDTLIRNFLKKIADLLGKELEKRKIKLGNFIEKYGALGGFVGVDFTQIGKSLSEIDLEDWKNKIDDFLKESTSKLVIFVDDIDRLDKQEIYSLFRLVKLTGDFSNTTYILSFDEIMVASAIGDRFGAGNELSGQNFLEKIIQVPLKIPQAQISALKTYCFELVDKAIDESEIKLSQSEEQRFVYQFTESVLLRLKTPRLAVRYGNSLSFALPLLKGEINHIDLMLIEALKIFYPRHYEFVKLNSNYFITSYSSENIYGVEQNVKDKKDELTQHLDILATDLSKKEKSSVLSLLKFLFPRLNEAFHNRFQHEGEKNWFKEKRIVSTDYFKRYFSYTVIDGEISDIIFDDFVNSIKILEIDNIADKLDSILTETSADTFIFKLRSYEEDLDWTTSKKLSLALCIKSRVFPTNDSFFGFGYDDAKSQSSIFIFQLLKRHLIIEETFEFTKLLMENPVPIDFSFLINKWFRNGRTKTENIFSEEQNIEIARILRERALSEAGETPLFEKYPKNINFLLSTWLSFDNIGYIEYLNQIFSKQPNKVKELLITFTPSATSTSNPEIHKSNFTKEQYNYIKTLIDKNLIHQKIRQIYGEEIDKKEVEYIEFENKQTDINIMRQFEDWFEKDAKEIEPAE
ncbi:P-loop NTPase fold protein [Flavobacterium sp. 11]|uniref:KAP family P-loop NTPase fold protein n=1 Tax=Flavobacterium sp. 11 TaxID=357523 RepID=UPI000C184271|nr:P-loop NTPase fold protein [Flavobacterium sp. 11]PIF63182.1 KAP-like P-loop domain-containing protein [Flavobacterium sp. 11]